MTKNIIIKLTSSSSKAGPFQIKDQNGNIIADSVEKSELASGISYTVDASVTSVKLINLGSCNREKTMPVSGIIDYNTMLNNPYEQKISTCMFRHLTRIDLFNDFYGDTHPYILEHPFAYSAQDEILQNVKDYTKVFKYLPDGTGVFNYNDKIAVDDKYFTKAVIYNDKQSSGVLELTPKPKNNLKLYNTYPLYRANSKVIPYTKSDNFYNINIFWDCVKDQTKPLFITNCSSLSIDREVNNDNMDYGKRSYNKAPLRAKDSKVRLIYENNSEHLVSQFILENTMLSYK